MIFPSAAPVRISSTPFLSSGSYLIGRRSGIHVFISQHSMRHGQERGPKLEALARCSGFGDKSAWLSHCRQGKMNFLLSMMKILVRPPRPMWLDGTRYVLCMRIGRSTRASWEASKRLGRRQRIVIILINTYVYTCQEQTRRTGLTPSRRIRQHGCHVLEACCCYT
ncbi:hypothetical protein M426DRAFT_142888 [Hypoxylon sp. CI-4A]|nr:hypothetical protein M426DRAFT_142888 [Hypoxylon sp. CI-4A]